MKVAISNGHEEADFIVKMYRGHSNKLVVINSDINICNEISKKNASRYQNRWKGVSYIHTGVRKTV